MKVQREDTEIQRIERKYMKAERLTTYIALEEMDFHWSQEEVLTFDEKWREGESLEEIAEYFDRDIDEVALLLMDRARNGHVDRRKQGIH